MALIQSCVKRAHNQCFDPLLSLVPQVSTCIKTWTHQKHASVSDCNFEQLAVRSAHMHRNGRCIMARVCHTNNCPVGVASQREELRARFPGAPGDLVNYFHFIAEEVQTSLYLTAGRTNMFARLSLTTAIFLADEEYPP